MRRAWAALLTLCIISCSSERASQLYEKEPQKKSPTASVEETQPQQVSGAALEPAGADALVESQTLKAELMRALQELMGSELDGRSETASKQMIEVFQSEDSGFLMVSPDVEKQLARGEVDEAVARQRIRTAIANFEAAEVPAPLLPC